MAGDLAASRRVWEVQFSRTRLSLEALGPLPSENGMSTALPRSTLAKIRPFLQSLTIFAGLVTGLFWAAAFSLVALRSADPAFTGTTDFLGAVLFFWTASILPSLLVPAVHLLLVHLTARWLSGCRLRLVSALLAICVLPILLFDPILSSNFLISATPATVLLALYGWAAAGIIEAHGAASRLDRVVHRVGLVLVIMLAGSLLAIVAYSWIEVLVT